MSNIAETILEEKENKDEELSALIKFHIYENYNKGSKRKQKQEDDSSDSE